MAVIKIYLRKYYENPHIATAKLQGKLDDCYKIKLRQVGYRLVDHVNDNELIVLVVAVGRRDKDMVYKIASTRN